MRLSDAMESWARWVHSGQLMPQHSISQTGKVMEILTLGITGPGHDGAPAMGCSNDAIETAIEVAVSRLSATGRAGPRRAAVLRTEFLMPVRDTRRAQEIRAISLHIPLRSYQRLLAEALEYVLAALEAQPSLPRIVRG